MFLASNRTNRQAYLFVAVSTDSISNAPLVPGSLTYSNLGAGACPWAGFFTRSASKTRGFGESSRLEVNALEIMRGTNQERDGGRGVVGVVPEGVGRVVRIVGAGDVTILIDPDGLIVR